MLVNLNGQHALEAIDPDLYRRSDCCPQVCISCKQACSDPFGPLPGLHQCNV